MLKPGFYNRSVTVWHVTLLLSVTFAVFFLPLLPPAPQRLTFRLVYSAIYVAALFSLKRRRPITLVLFFTSFFAEWITGFLEIRVLHDISKSINIIFFLLIVATFIKQIAMARKVNAGVILESISAYLLLGIIYSIIVAYILQYDPTAFAGNRDKSIILDYGIDSSVPLYFSFVTMATLGYGDIVPLKPYTRALSTWIAISGQLYIAVIMALLVGKFASQSSNDDPGSE
jgi:hypothetical protein